MPDEHVLYDVAHGVATITLSRPAARNAFDVPMLKALHRASCRAAVDRGVRAIVVTGAGGHFCAGADVKLFAEKLAAGGDEVTLLVEEMTAYLHSAIATLARAPKPWLCAVDGTAAGGGLGLAIAADATIASDRAQLTYAYTNIGLAPDGSASWSLPRLLGPRKALWLAYRNPRLSAAEALALGLVTEVYPAAAFDDRARELARELAAGPTLSLAASKRLLRASSGRHVESQMEEERDAITACSRSADFREGIAAFLEKRPARFRGE
jgi:2-(1,2-epoxy-1,2-dihydrophenyl)acetyl-CoA isomerase